MERREFVIVGILVAAAAAAVVFQIGRDPVGAAAERTGPGLVELGQPLEEQHVRSLSGERLSLHGLLGKQATVFYAWSVTCPCVDTVNERLMPVIERFRPQGVEFLAVAGDGKDDVDAIAGRLVASWGMPRPARKPGEPARPPLSSTGAPPYGMVSDPSQRLSRQLGFREAAQFVVVDANGVLCYRGTFDNDLKKPTATWLPDAIEDVVEGRHVASPLRPVPGYGCPFGIPPADCPVDAPGS
jgi:hypothetical protein